MSWWDVVDTGVGILEAYLSGDSKVKPKDAFKLANPNVTSPFYNTTSSWNNGQPTQNREMSPELAEIFQNLIFDQLNEPRESYQMSDAMRGAYDSQVNWQRERFGLDPMENATSGYGRPVDSTTGEETGDEEPDYGGGRGGEEPDYGTGGGGGGGGLEKI